MRDGEKPMISRLFSMGRFAALLLCGLAFGAAPAAADGYGCGPGGCYRPAPAPVVVAPPVQPCCVQACSCCGCGSSYYGSYYPAYAYPSYASSCCGGYGGGYGYGGWGYGYGYTSASYDVGVGVPPPPVYGPRVVAPRYWGPRRYWGARRLYARY